ncbi:hypothetical protein [Marininema halotolerans]|uniref:Uncharacterized protein n=1 Tax=Marininema halotolerans TaxID=1155944 RepID=A0A1I6PCX5_9BACL|nr:hypothetical protein [Marininema halotolerans]SFS38000.1 hypothetical protein SAMN05444972_101506 [Marininema halotolerans]
MKSDKKNLRSRKLRISQGTDNLSGMYRTRDGLTLTVQQYGKSYFLVGSALFAAHLPPAQRNRAFTNRAARTTNAFLIGSSTPQPLTSQRARDFPTAAGSTYINFDADVRRTISPSQRRETEATVHTTVITRVDENTLLVRGEESREVVRKLR